MNNHQIFHMINYMRLFTRGATYIFGPPCIMRDGTSVIALRAIFLRLATNSASKFERTSELLQVINLKFKDST